MSYTLILTILFYLIMIINFSAALYILFVERRDIGSTWAWIFVFFFLPVVGFLVYLFLGRSPKSKISDDNQENSKVLHLHQEKLIETLPWNLQRVAKGAVRSHAPLTYADEVRVLFDGHQKFNTLLNDIQNAEIEINVQYFILKNDALGELLLSALFDSAKKGVKVRILYDAIGSWKLRKSDFIDFQKNGGEVRSYSDSPFGLLNLNINNRNHRKLCTIDNSISYLGGFNVGEEYLGEDEQFGYWRDTHVRMTGPVVQELESHFEMDWAAAMNENIPLPSRDSLFNLINSHNSIPVQVISSGPTSEKEYIKLTLIHMIYTARKSIMIQTPYFIPDASFMDACLVALDAGVELSIMIPNRPDHPFVYWATYAACGELITHGAKVFTYEAGFLHAKTIVIDSQISSVGTTNIDARSFRLNFETNAIFYDINTAEKLEKLFLSDASLSLPLTKELYANRSKWIRFKEGIARLLTPIL